MDSSPHKSDTAETKAMETLRQCFGHQQFREGQEAALRSILGGRNVLAVMPTGSGKSLLYQLPAMLEDGLTLVVSPLIALMKDQVDELARRGIPATFINSSLDLRQQQERLRRCLDGQVRLLYVAPERFRSEAFLAMIRRVRVTRLAVDEAHCISEWGHDFRPDYRRLKESRQQMRMPPVTALTATATPRVQQDIIESLGLKPAETDVHVHGFDRPNLALAVSHAPQEDAKNDFVREFISRQRGCGIIYVGTRSSAEEVAVVARTAEPHTIVYHAGMEAAERSGAQEAFLSGRARVAVATMAFGMGIDKPDVRFVLHYHFPGSVEQYYQEIGRAGRDGLPAECVLLYSAGDRALREFFIDLNYPTPDQVRSVYDALVAADANPVMMTYREIAGRCDEDLKEGQVGAAIRLLDGAGVTRALSGNSAATVRIDRPGAQVLAGVRGQSQRRVFESLASVIDLETPGQYPIYLGQIAAASQLSEEQVRRALTALHDAGHLEYEPPFRGRGVEKLADPLPAFDRVPIDWQRHRLLRELEEEKLRNMESYILGRECRREFILRYFGERSHRPCGRCDCCKSSGTAHARGRGVLARRPGIALPVLICTRDLRFPLGVTRTAQVVTGSRSKDLIAWGLDRNPAYGRVSAGQDEVRRVIEELIAEGYLERCGEASRPVLGLTAAGEAAAEAAEIDVQTSSRAPQPARPPSKAGHSPDEAAALPEREQAGGPPLAKDLTRCLDRLIDGLLTADRDDAKLLVETLRLFHPRHIAARLGARYDASADSRARARAVWAAGELCGTCGFGLLVRCTRDKEVTVRRLAASALGKAASDAQATPTVPADEMAQARQALEELAGDPAPQVRQYAQKSLAALLRLRSH